MNTPGIDDPAARGMLARQGQFFAHARALGMKTCIISLSNEAYATSPRQLRASSKGGKNGYVRNLAGHYHVETCPSNLEGEKYIYDVRREICQAMQRVGIAPDYWITGPYDPGWMYLRCLRAMGNQRFSAHITQYLGHRSRIFPPMPCFIMSTWCFGKLHRR